MLDREDDVAMVEDLAKQLNWRCPEDCGRNSDLGHVELEILSG